MVNLFQRLSVDYKSLPNFNMNKWFGCFREIYLSNLYQLGKHGMSESEITSMPIVLIIILFNHKINNHREK